jgi:hypothetical protein
VSTRALNDADFAARVRRVVDSRAVRGNRLLIQYVPPTGTNYSVTGTSFTEVDATNLSGHLLCTGRPIRIDLWANVAKGGGSTVLQLSVTMDGVEVTNTSNGMALVFDTGTAYTVSGWHVILTPQPGERLFSVVAKVNAGTSTIFGDGNNRIAMSVKEE